MTTSPNSQSRTQAERTAASDQAMIEAAIELLLAKGSVGTTLAAIGEKAGYSRGLATYRFGSKAGLFDKICRTISKRWLAVLTTEVGAKTGIDAMCAALDAYVRFVNTTPRDAKVMQLLYGDATNPNAETTGTAIETYRRQVADVCDWIESGQANGDVRADVIPETEAVRFIAHLAGMTHLWLLMPNEVNFLATNESYKTDLRRHLAKSESVS